MNSKAIKITDSSVLIESDDGVKTQPADNVITSAGYIPTPLAPQSSHIHVVGDAVKVGNLLTVILGVYDVVMKL